MCIYISPKQMFLCVVYTVWSRKANKMLPVFVILVASSALASAGTLKIFQVSTNTPMSDNSLVSRVYNSFGQADHISPNVLNMGETLRDLSKSGGDNQALANGQLVAYLGDTSVGRAGDACTSANYINAYTRYVATGNPAGVREALGNYIQQVASNVDNIVKRVTNQTSVKSVQGARGGCPNEGKSYDIDAAWDIILGAAPTNHLSPISEQYSVAKRLYCSISAFGNNVAAQFTASALPPSVQVFELAGRALDDFLSRVAAKADLGQSAATLKGELCNAVSKVSL